MKTILPLSLALLAISLCVPGCGSSTSADDPVLQSTPEEEVLAVLTFTAAGSGSGGEPVEGFVARLGWYEEQRDRYWFFDITPPLTGDETGMSFELRVDAAADPHFLTLLEHLTDGVDSVVARGGGAINGGGGGGGRLESETLAEVGDWQQGPDLAGATITALETHVTRISATTGTPYSYSLEVIVLIWGTL